MTLSILIPTYNDDCLQLVTQLHEQAEAITDLQFEIIVADDGSTRQEVVERNRQITQLTHAIYIIRCKNSGRAAIRNFLVQQAHYDRLLLIDSDMTVIRPDFISRYLQEPDDAIIYGGYEVSANGQDLRGNLRYRYERMAAPLHTAPMRSRKPYQDFHTSNFLVSRNLFLNHPLDERFTHYGYEDVLWGKELEANAIRIRHIDNPLGFCTFEDNAAFLNKTEEAMRTLWQFRNELEGYSTLLATAQRLQRCHLAGLVRTEHRLLGWLWRRLLVGNSPSLGVFRLYKMGYYLEMKN